MAIGPKLTLRQSTSLVMTPQLQQAIKLLQLSNLELSAYVEQELEQNPLLEREDSDREEVARGEPAEGEGRAGEEPAEVRDSAEMASDDSLPSEGESPLDTDFGNVWNEDGAAGDPEAFANWSGGSGKGGGDFEDGEYNLEHTLSKAVSLRDHLLAQINIELDDPVDRLIGIDLIDMLDEAGYLSGEMRDVAERLGCDIALVESTLGKLQKFDPPGVFARSLAECLALQLRDRNRLDPAIQALLDNLDLLAKRDLAALRRICGVDNEDLAQMIDEIRALDPKPGLAFDAPVAQPVTPDVIVKPHPKGGWQIELNAETLPRVLVNQSYYAKVTKDARSKQDRDYLTDRLQSANWLVRSLHQRATTILKVATEIVRRQDGFLQNGVRHLKPLTLRDIAAVIDMHESTVSRVTTNKYMSTPRGIYEMKYFFTSAIASSVGGADAHSAESVRFRIKALIDEEKPAEVLSDDRIVEILKGEGVDIARRTVAKYREAMRIPSSVQRRREQTSTL
jgi:RNA polymerase sigma-54 factor